MPCDTARETLVKIDRDTEDDERYGGAYNEQPPTYEKVSQYAQENSAKKNGYARPTEAIAPGIKDAQASLQSLYLSLNDCQTFLFSAQVICFTSLLFFCIL
jgi:hypothetical protein